MTNSPPTPPPSIQEIATRVDDRLTELLDDERRRWSDVDDRITYLLDTVQRFTAGGKRLRPAFCFWGFVGAGGDHQASQIIDAGAAYELLHAFALMHDDVMDDSDTRRGLPTVHTEYIDMHSQAGWSGEARRFGEGIAILAGDLLHVYADRLLIDAPSPARVIWAELRIEINMGQYLDVLSTAQARRDLEIAQRVARYKSAKYTIERPLHLGAAMAGRLDELSSAYTAYGIPLGIAFQYRDDILGAFGDPELTGKPVGEDLREGKPTALLAMAAGRATSAQNEVLDRIGRRQLSDRDIASIQNILVDTGARATVEDTIAELTDEAVTAVSDAPLDRETSCALIDLAYYIAAREL